jgi:hypothetical protein
VLVAELFSLFLLGDESAFGAFPSVQVEIDQWESNCEPSHPEDSIEHWYLDDSDQLQEGVGHTIPGLTSGHALIRLAYAMNIVPEDMNLPETLGFFWPERLGKWSPDAPVSSTLNREIDNGPHSRAYQELIVSACGENMTIGTLCSLIFDFAQLMSWYSGRLSGATDRMTAMREQHFALSQGFCRCDHCVQDELPF